MSIKLQIAIRVVSGPDEGAVFLVKDVAFIGTGSNCSISLTDPCVSNIHARLRIQGDTFHITDLTTKLDMKVNGVLVKARSLEIGDRVSIADSVLDIIDPLLLSAGGASSIESPSVLAEEEGSITKIIRRYDYDDVTDDKGSDPPESEPDEEEAGFFVQPVAEISAEIPTAAEETMKKYREKALLRQNRKSEKKSTLIIALIVFLIAGISIGAFLVNRKLVKGKLDARYHAAIAYADSNPDDVDKIISTYNGIVVDAIGVYDQLAHYLSSEVKRIEDDIAQEDKSFSELLKSLDEKADKLVAEHEFEKAIEVYNISGAEKAKEVAAARSDHIKEIQQSGKVYQRQLVTAAAKKEAALASARKIFAEKEWDKALVAAVDALVAGDGKKAIDLMERLRGIVTIDEVRNNASDVIDIANEVIKVSESTNTMDAVSLKGFSPAAKAAIAIAKEDFLTARGALKKEKNNDLKRELLKHVRISDEDMVVEKRAIRAFADVWEDLTGANVTRIQKPETCATELKEILKGKNTNDVERISGNLLKCKNDYKDTMFVARYSVVFDALNEMSVEDEIAKIDAKGLYDGKVLQVSGDDVFVELTSSVVDPLTVKVGIFYEKTIYVSPGEMTPVAALIDVQAVLPFKVISDKQIMFVKSPLHPVPQPGQSVLVRENLKTGDLLINNIKLSDSSVMYKSDFEKVLGKGWSSGRDRGALKISEGQLSYSPRSDLVSRAGYKAGSGDIILQTKAVKGAMKLEFDLLMGGHHPLLISLGNIDFMIGSNLHKWSGIYRDGKLIVAKQMTPVGLINPMRVVVERGENSLSLSVGTDTVACPVNMDLLKEGVNAVRFFGLGKLSLDNLVFQKTGSATQVADVAGVSADGGQVVFLQTMLDASAAKVGDPVYLFVPAKDKKSKQTVLKGAMSGKYGEIIACTISKGEAVSTRTTVSFDRELIKKVTSPLSQLPPSISAGLKKASDSVLIGSYEKASGSGIVRLGIVGQVPARGYLSAVSDILVHPETKEPLAAVVSDSVRSIFKQDRGTVICKFAETSIFSEDTSKGVLISSRKPPVRRSIDITGSRRISSAVPLSSKMKKQAFWRSVSGDWKVKTGRILAARDSVAEPMPVVQLSEIYSSNAQFDIDLRLGVPEMKLKKEWARNFMVELYFPSRQSGVTFGLDTGKKGVLVSGRTLSLVGDSGIMSLNGALPEGTGKVVQTGADGAPMGLTSGTDYNLRIRRTGSILEVLVNGKRLAYVKHNDIRGDAVIRVGAPFGMLSLGKASVMSLPEKCVISEEEPELGEFGYVVFASDKQFLMDSDMNGLEVNGKISIMKLDNIVQGDSSRTVILKRVAQGVISEIGPRIAKVLVTEQDEPVERGMKVFLGARPESLILTDVLKIDFERGF